MWHSQNDKGDGVFNFDRTTWGQYKTDFSSKIIDDRPDGLTAIYLTKLNDAERVLSNKFRDLITDPGIESANTAWEQIMASNKELKTGPHTDEQKEALEKIYTSRLTVLTGAAGTGKTTVIKSLVIGIKETNPHHDFLLLAPTGKASLILRKRLADPTIPVMTLHSFLMRQGWINANNFTLRERGKGKKQVKTVIVDECSMIDTQLFYTMIKALDMNNIERLVLVGDYNQLPPVGPGKVFYDLIQYLRGDEERKNKHLAELQFNWRQEQGSKSSRLAEHYARIDSKPDEDIFAEISSGDYDVLNTGNTSDLVIDYWHDEEELIDKMPGILEYAVSRVNSRVKGSELSERYDEVHGIPNAKEKNIEAIHIISPYRHTPTGVDNINIQIQKILRGSDTVRKFGKDGFVFRDKVLQTRNYTYSASDYQKKKTIKDETTYIPNGTLGFVFPKGDFEVKFPEDYENLSYFITKKQKDEMLELGYATSVHKAQGSQFDVTITIIPNESDFLSREMLYTALTRSKKCQIILIQNDINFLKARLWLGDSEIVKRNSSLFSKSFGIPSKDLEKYKPENLVCEALPDLFVRSKDEVMISKALANAGIQFYYEKLLPSNDERSFKLPDFTFIHRRKTYYWEHKGMLDVFDYVQRDEKKDRWYKENGYQDNLIVTPREGMNLAESIKYIFENILNIY
jgi:ATP-dependent exoDNAse (exonuclease V) alpha subunit